MVAKLESFTLPKSFKQLFATPEPNEPGQNIDPFITVIIHQTRQLRRIFSLEYGLLDELVVRGVLSSEQVEHIQENSTQQSRIVWFIEELIGDPHRLTRNVNRFYGALNHAHHKHVANFIKSDGIRLAEYGEHWPLICCDSEIRRLDNYRDSFIELVDTRCGLLDEMLSSFIIDIRHLHRIDAGVTDADKNELLLNMLRRRCLATYNTFIRSLMTTKQYQVVSLLAPEALHALSPLGMKQQSRLNTNYDVLLHIMDTKSELMTQLHAADCITRRQKEYIESATNQTESNRRLVDIMRRGSEEDFNKFIECLNSTGRQKTSRIMLEDAVVVPIVLSIGGTEKVQEDEMHIVEQIAVLLRDTSNDLRLPLCETVIRHLTELRDNAIEMLDAKRGSVVLLFSCKSLGGLHYLHDLYDSEQLKEMMQETVSAVLNARENSGLRIDTLQWSTPDYNSCVRNMRGHTEMLQNCSLPDATSK